MGSSFSGLQLGAQAIHAASRGLDTTGQNIANSATPGHSRQRLQQVAIGGPEVPAIWSKYDGASGGVRVTGVERMRDEFLEARARTAGHQLATVTEQAKAHAAIERTFNEPSKIGLSNQLNEMWKTWNALAQNPQIASAGDAVIAATNATTSQIKSMNNQLTTQWNDTRAEVDGAVVELNTALKDIAGLNKAIRSNAVNGIPANELRDQRDALVEKVTTLTGGQAEIADLGVVNIKLNGTYMVVGTQPGSFSATGPATFARPVPPATTTTPVGVSLVAPGDPVPPAQPMPLTSGTLHGKMQALNTIVPGHIAELDAVANTVITKVNDANKLGWTTSKTAATPPATGFVGVKGADLFQGSNASDIALVAGANAGSLGVSQGDPITPVPPAVSAKIDGNNASDIARIQYALDGPDAKYRGQIARLGIEASSINNNQKVLQNVVKQSDDARDSVSGVSLNEEMTNLMQYQHAYESAARYINTINTTLDALINIIR